MFEEVCGSTFKEEQLLVNIDSGANHIIIKIALLGQLTKRARCKSKELKKLKFATA